MANVTFTDVNVLDVTTDDQDFKAGTAITVRVRAEVGAALFGGGGKYRVQMTLTDTTDPKLLDSQSVTGNYGDANWPAAGSNTFTFTVPAAASTGRDGSICEPQARVVGNASAPFDTSFVVGSKILLTP
jgi:hypothetical protein